MTFLSWVFSALSFVWIVYLPGLAIMRLAEGKSGSRASYLFLPWIAGLLASAPILYLWSRWFKFTGPGSLLACALVAALLLGLSKLGLGKTSLAPRLSFRVLSG